MTSVGFNFVGRGPRGRGDVKVLFWPLGMLGRPLHLQAINTGATDHFLLAAQKAELDFSQAGIPKVAFH